MATTFTRLAGFASVLRARVAALFALDVRLLAELFRPELFLAEVFLPELFLAVLFFEALFLEVVFFEVLFLAALFLVVAPFFLAVPVLRFRVLPPRFLAVALFFAAVLRFLVPVARFLGDALLFDVERVRLVLLRPVLRLVALLRPVDLRPADFALEFPRDDFLVVAIHALRLSSRTGVTRSCMASFGRAGTAGVQQLKGSGFRNYPGTVIPRKAGIQTISHPRESGDPNHKSSPRKRGSMFGLANMDSRLRGNDGDFTSRSCTLNPAS